MSRFIAIANQKGGVGKTTTTVNLAASLARFGQRVLVLDMDPQGNASSGLGVSANAHDRGIYEVLMGALSVEEAVTLQASPGVDLLPSGQRLIGAEVELVSALARERILERAILSIRETYDILLADCPPSLGLLTVNTLTAADTVLIPMQCEYYALEGLTQLLNTIKLIQQALNPRLDIEGILLTMFDARLNLSHEVAEETRKFFPGRVYETVIPRNVRLSEAPSFGKPVLEYDPECAGAQFYLKLAREVLKLPADAMPLPLSATEEDSAAPVPEAARAPSKRAEPFEPRPVEATPVDLRPYERLVAEVYEVDDGPVQVTVTAPVHEVETAAPAQVVETTQIRDEAPPAEDVTDIQLRQETHDETVQFEAAETMRTGDAPATAMDEVPHVAIDDMPATAMEETPRVVMDDAPVATMDDVPVAATNDAQVMAMDDAPAAMHDASPIAALDASVITPFEGTDATYTEAVSTQREEVTPPHYIESSFDEPTQHVESHRVDEATPPDHIESRLNAAPQLVEPPPFESPPEPFPDDVSDDLSESEDVLTLPEESIVITETASTQIASIETGNNDITASTETDANVTSDLQPMTEQDAHHPQEELVSHD